MAKLNHIAIGMLILQTYATGLPSGTDKIEDTVNISEKPKLDAESQTLPQENKKNSSLQGPRQKRFYDHFNFGFSPFNSDPYLYQNRRDQFVENGGYAVEDPVSQIHRRIQEIANSVRQPVPLPPPVHIPFYFPVLFIPQNDCACTPDSNVPSPAPDTSSPPSQGNDTNPDVNNRFSSTEDEEGDVGEDFSRPISFDPIQATRPSMRPAPPVDHGSTQGDVPNPVQTTTIRPPPPQSVGQSAFYPANARPGNASPGISSSDVVPNPCDGAILTCCHQFQVTYDCFASQGCVDPGALGNPCDVRVILGVIERYQRFYAQRNG